MRKGTILAVDDEKDLLTLVKYILEREGYRVLCAANGMECLESARSQRPDMILLDVMLPAIDGHSVCRMLKNMTETASIPVVMFSARPKTLGLFEGGMAGADDYLQKPFTRRELLDMVRSFAGGGGNPSWKGGSSVGGLPPEAPGETRAAWTGVIAFTLMELLVVVSIIAVMAALLLPALNGARQKAQSLLCISTLKQHGVAVNMYATDCNGTLPGAVGPTTSQEWEYLFSHKLTDDGICLADYYNIDVAKDKENGQPAGHSSNYNATAGPLTRMQKYCCPTYISRYRNGSLTYYNSSANQYQEKPYRRGYVHCFSTDSATWGPYRGSPGWRSIGKIGAQGPVSPETTSGWSYYWSLKAAPSRLAVICDYKFNRGYDDQAIPYHVGNGHKTGYGYLTLDGGAKFSPRCNTSNSAGWDDRPAWVLR